MPLAAPARFVEVVRENQLEGGDHRAGRGATRRFDGVCRAADGTRRVVAARRNVGSAAMFTDGRLTVHA